MRRDLWATPPWPRQNKRKISSQPNSTETPPASMSTRTEQIADILRTLRATSPEVIGAAVVSAEGFIIASVLPNDTDEDLIGGMAASLLGVGERISADLMRSQMDQVYVRSPKGYILLNAINAAASVVVLVTKEAKLGLIFLELKRAIGELANCL